MTSIRPGATLRGKFLIESMLGSGGMGTVYQAVHLRMRKRVALKVLCREHAGSAVSVSRFEREGLAAARMRGAHAVRIFDVDTTEDGLPFLVMELLRGRELSKILSSSVVPDPVAIDWTIQICSAIQEAHDLGIVHRDLKPSNIFIAEPDKIIKVVDFGISKHRDGLDLTADSEVLGTPKYMAPEQLRAQTVSPSMDIWAIGIILYRMLGRVHPFPVPEGAPPFVAAAATLTDEPVPIEKHRPDMPEALSRTVMKALIKDPARRWGSARELGQALEPFGSGHVQFKEAPDKAHGDSLPPILEPDMSVPASYKAQLSRNSSLPPAMLEPSGDVRPLSEKRLTRRFPSDSFSEEKAESERGHRSKRRSALWIAGSLLVVAIGVSTAIVVGLGDDEAEDSNGSAVLSPGVSSVIPVHESSLDPRDGGQGAHLEDGIVSAKPVASVEPTASNRVPTPPIRPPATSPKPTKPPSPTKQPAVKDPLYL